MALTVARTDRWVLTAAEFDVLWEWLRLGATPVALRLDSPGHTDAARAAIAGRGGLALRERGLADTTGPHPELVRLLHLLARPSAQLELLMGRGHRVRAVAAGRAGSGALAVRQDETVAVGPCVELAAALVDVLAAVPAGPNRIVIAALAADSCGVLRRLPRTVRTDGTASTTADGRRLRQRATALLAQAWETASRYGPQPA